MAGAVYVVGRSGDALRYPGRAAGSHISNRHWRCAGSRPRPAIRPARPDLSTICAARCDCGRDGMGDPGPMGCRLACRCEWGQAHRHYHLHHPHSGWPDRWCARLGGARRLGCPKGSIGCKRLCGRRRALRLHPARRGHRNCIADLYRLGRVGGWRRSHAALRGPVDAFSPSLCGSSVREHRRIAVCCHAFHPVGRWWRRRDMAACGIRSNVSDRLCDGIHGADRIATRCSGLVLVSSIGNTRRRAERRGSRCVCASGAGPLGTATHSWWPAGRRRCGAGRLCR